MRRRPKLGTKPASRMAALQSRIRLVSVRTALISPIFVIPTAINSLGLLVRQADFYHQIYEDRPVQGRSFLRRTFFTDLASFNTRPACNSCNDQFARRA